MATQSSCLSLLEEASSGVEFYRGLSRLDPTVFIALKRLKSQFDLNLVDKSGSKKQTQVLDQLRSNTLEIGSDIFDSNKSQSLLILQKIKNQIKFIRKIQTYGFEIAKNGELIPMNTKTELGLKVKRLRDLFGITVSVDHMLFGPDLPEKALGYYEPDELLIALRPNISLWRRYRASTLQDALLSTLKHEQTHAIAFSQDSDYFLGRSLVLSPGKTKNFEEIDAYGKGYHSDEVDAFIKQYKHGAHVKEKIPKRIKHRIEKLIEHQLYWFHAAMLNDRSFLTGNVLIVEDVHGRKAYIYFMSRELDHMRALTILKRRQKDLQRKLDFVRAL